MPVSVLFLETVEVAPSDFSLRLRCGLSVSQTRRHGRQRRGAGATGGPQGRLRPHAGLRSSAALFGARGCSRALGPCPLRTAQAACLSGNVLGRLQIPPPLCGSRCRLQDSGRPGVPARGTGCHWSRPCPCPVLSVCEFLLVSGGALVGHPAPGPCTWGPLCTCLHPLF